MCIYAADHANSCKNSILYFRWMALEMEEYYQQGDIERKLGYTITPYFDRSTCNPFIFQKGYIVVVVEPLYKTLLEFMPTTSSMKQDCITKGLDENKGLLDLKIDETKNIVNMSMSAHDLTL